MNEMVRKQHETGLAISQETLELIQSSIADSTLKRYSRLSKELESWLGGQMLNDALLGKIHHRVINFLPRILSPRSLSQNLG